MDSMDTTAKPSSPVTAPARWYTDPTLWPVERRDVFARNWQFLTHESAVPHPREWRADTLAGYPVVIVRGDDGVLRAFHNVCRHRAGPLTREEAGTCDGYLTCQYHGWRYTLDGRLRAARDFGATADFDPREYGLYPIRLQTWRGLVFAGIGDDLPDLSVQIAPLDARLNEADWSNLKVGLRRAHLLDCNWKTYVENYLEGYHVPSMHPSLDAEIVAEQYKVTVEGRVVLHDAPPKSPDAVYDGLWGWVWPNIGINVYSRGLMIERMSPVGADQTQLDYLYLTPDGEPVPEATIAMSDQVTAEDKWIVEKVQENLNAGVYDTGRLSPKHETAVTAFQRWVGSVIA
ncbi:aromatic ring-hydroxylating oxygenase subunit alpha [Asticcacaulis sp. 201]|uniref:aromatic ring-hydroxylating oxygenase subunit alpha n=1 Tax=Asticcacaulis sp. 201 TaxID=3028787 RepID=UPI002915FF49|nr:SRPBCC family protein [Asticcacaulis sp. 201]MDV6332272.1 SRPBCC family protein [Asticcacaulis sp. 201]